MAHPRNADLLRWQAEFPDATPIADLQARHPGTCVGVVRRIRVVPRKALEVTVEDGSGRLTAAFPPAARIAGLELGSALRLTGTVAETGGQRLMRNPAWAPVREPYATATTPARRHRR